MICNVIYIYIYIYIYVYIHTVTEYVSGKLKISDCILKFTKLLNIA